MGNTCDGDDQSDCLASIASAMLCKDIVRLVEAAAIYEDRQHQTSTGLRSTLAGAARQLLPALGLSSVDDASIVESHCPPLLGTAWTASSNGSLGQPSVILGRKGAVPDADVARLFKLTHSFLGS